ncbi:MAG: cell division protein FtsL [Bdellovibrionales bacterium]
MLKPIRIRTFVVFACAALSGAALLHASQRVQEAENRLVQIQAETDKEQDAIRVLRAEWEYLNNPARLEALAAEFLHMAPPAPKTVPQTLVNSVADMQAGADSVAAERPAPVKVIPVSSRVAPAIAPPKPPAPAPVAPTEKQKDFNDILKSLDIPAKDGGAP